MCLAFFLDFHSIICTNTQPAVILQAICDLRVSLLAVGSPFPGMPPFSLCNEIKLVCLSNQDKEHPKLVVIGTAPTILVCASQSLFFYFFISLRLSFSFIYYHLSYGGIFSFRMKSLEQDALKAQMVIAKSRDGKKRGTLDQLTESPSPAPTPSPTPMEGRKLLSLIAPMPIHIFFSY